MTLPALVLASASPARRALLAAAGLGFEIVPAEVSRQRPEALVIGADQVLAVEGELLDKPADRAAAADFLARLQGRGHALVSAVSLATQGAVAWRHAETARLAMRPRGAIAD